MDHVSLTLSPESVRHIVDQLAIELRNQRNEYVYSRDRAKVYVDRSSDDAFDAWRKKHKVRSCSHGRYAKRHLDAALQNEARLRP